MMRSNRLFVIFLLLGTTLFPHLLCAQNDKGSITGHVTDSSGAFLRGAEIELQPTGRIVASNQQGAYFINNLAPGTYTITVTYVGFSLFTKVVNVIAGRVATVDAKMEVNSQKDSIVVTAERASGSGSHQPRKDRRQYCAGSAQ
jgi:hypothetical protein